MATTDVRPSNLHPNNLRLDSTGRPVLSLPGRRYDHQFFTTTSVLMMATVFAGFAHSYYLAGVFSAPLPSLIIHLHGAAFSAWIILLIVQTSLTSAGRVDIHRKLGMAGFVLGCAMIVLGILAATDSLVRSAGPVGRDPKAFYIVPLGDILIFGTLLFFAFRARFDPPAHKRLIYLATTSILIAAIARLPFAFSNRKNRIDVLLSYTFLVILIAYDWWSTRRIHRVTLWASGFLIFVQQIRFYIGKTGAWHAFATWVQGWSRHLLGYSGS